MTDYHCHILPGLDDGAADLLASLAMARILAAAGFTRICCTPHRIYGAYDTSPQRVRLETTLLQGELLAAGINVTLVPGLEYYLDEYYPDLLADPLLLPGNFILVEIPSRCEDAEFIFSLLSRTLKKGLTPLIAHPERSALLSPPLSPPSFWHTCFRPFSSAKEEARRELPYPTLLFRQLWEMGCRFQGNFGSFSGFYGELPLHYAALFQRDGYYSHYGSDAHHPRQLQSYLRQGMAATGVARGQDDQTFSAG